MSTTPDPAAVKDAHEGHGSSGCYPRATTMFLGSLPHCLPWLLADALLSVVRLVEVAESLTLTGLPAVLDTRDLRAALGQSAASGQA
jgi:hypothetical protein